jgi:4a-hydroxytetrahydrobiopterin dehydratase
MSNSALTGQQIADADLDGWALITHYGISRLHTRIHTKDFATARQVVNAIGQVADEMNHYADLDLRSTRVDVRLCSGNEAGGVTEVDVDVARRTCDIATAAGAQQECRSITLIELGLDSPDHGRIGPFWAAVLGSKYTAGEGFSDVIDPHQALPLIYFQHSGSEEPRQRWHLDVFVDPALVQERIQSAVAAGGTLVSDEHAPSFWVLSDPEGNKACLCI